MAECVDIDLNFSPSTNLLPIRRFDLSVGASAIVRAAWLRFAGMDVYLYKERRSNTRIIGKFYGGIADQKPGSVLQRMAQEFKSLHYIRGLGFAGYPRYPIQGFAAGSESPGAGLRAHSKIISYLIRRCIAPAVLYAGILSRVFFNI